MKKLLKKIKITTKLELLSGLHIGGSSENVEIGGIDNPVIKAALKNNQPYIPGSSIKGKIRCLLEQTRGAKLGENDEINNLFGYSNKNMPSKIIVRDAYLDKESITKFENSEGLDLPFTEVKFENTIDRISGTAKDPRQMERIPAGVCFDLEFIINVWDKDNNGEELKKIFAEGLKALENDYIGGSGTRGYGHIKLGERKYEEITFIN